MLINSKLEISRYTLNEEIGRGSFGIVYKAIDRINGALVAVKKFPAIGQLNEKILIQFNQEVDLMIKLTSTKNSRILPILDFRTIGPYACIITKYCEGGSLRNLLEKNDGKLSEIKVLNIIKQIAQAFVELNALLTPDEVLIHRDLKPDNILFNDDLCNNVVLGDFGLGKIAYTDILNQQQKHSSRVGSQAYMSIQVNDGDDYTSKCDVFSCGMIAFECLFGKTLLRKQLKELLSQGGSGCYSDPLWTKLNHNTQDLILKMLTLEEKDRLDWKEVLAHPAIKKIRLIQVIEEDVEEKEKMMMIMDNNQGIKSNVSYEEDEPEYGNNEFMKIKRKLNNEEQINAKLKEKWAKWNRKLAKQMKNLENFKQDTLEKDNLIREKNIQISKLEEMVNLHTRNPEINSFVADNLSSGSRDIAPEDYHLDDISISNIQSSFRKSLMENQRQIDKLTEELTKTVLPSFAKFMEDSYKY